MKRESKVGVSFLSILLASFIFISAVSAEDNVTANLTFGPETFDELKNNSNFIAGYGSIPSFTTVEERYQWMDTLNKIMDGVVADTNKKHEFKYFDPIGPVRTYSATFDGVMEISINNSTVTDKAFLDEFYQMIDSKANQMGVKEVPVIFVRENNLTLAELQEPETKPSAIEKKETIESNISINNDSNSINENTSNISNSSENKTSETSSTPGLSLLESIICLYGGWKLRKKQ